MKLGSGIWTQVLWKNNKIFYLLSHLSSPSHVSFKFPMGLKLHNHFFLQFLFKLKQLFIRYFDHVFPSSSSPQVLPSFLPTQLMFTFHQILKKAKTKKHNHGVCQLWLTNPEHRACPAVWLVSPVAFTGENWFLLLPAGISDKQQTFLVGYRNCVSS